jgi:hypothetical protein
MQYYGQPMPYGYYPPAQHGAYPHAYMPPPPYGFPPHFNPYMHGYPHYPPPHEQPRQQTVGNPAHHFGPPQNHAAKKNEFEAPDPKSRHFETGARHPQGEKKDYKTLTNFFMQERDRHQI